MTRNLEDSEDLIQDIQSNPRRALVNHTEPVVENSSVSFDPR